MQLTVTIIAIEERRSMAERLSSQVRDALPHSNAAIFYSAVPYQSFNAIANTRRALEFAMAAHTSWHLFLEDDQVLYPSFWTLLPTLLNLAEERGIVAFYLCNRKVRYAAQEVVGGIVMNRLDQRVNGSHGLLYSCLYTAKWLGEVMNKSSGPIDDTFWRALASVRPRPLVYQIVAPIVAQHVGMRSTLHSYEDNGHLLLNSVEANVLKQLSETCIS